MQTRTCPSLQLPWTIAASIEDITGLCPRPFMKCPMIKAFCEGNVRMAEVCLNKVGACCLLGHIMYMLLMV